MNRVLEFYQRFRHLIHEGAKFGIVGLTGILVTNIVFAPLHKELRLGVMTSVTIATVAATVVTFLGNRYWSFRNREGSGTGKEGATFFMLNGVGMLIQYAVLGLSHYTLGLTNAVEDQIAVNVGIGLGTLFRFWSYRKFIWVSAEERLARLRRGRHRKGRTTPVPDPADLVTAGSFRAGPAPARDAAIPRTGPRIPVAAPVPGSGQTTGYPATAYAAAPHPAAVPEYWQAPAPQPPAQPPTRQPAPSGRAQAHRGQPPYPGHQARPATAAADQPPVFRPDPRT